MIRSFAIAALILAPALAMADQGKNLEVKIKDGEMHCDECAQSVTAALKKVPNVDQGSVKVVIAKNMATVHVTNETKDTVAQIKKTLKDEGYDVTDVKAIN